MGTRLCEQVKGQTFAEIIRILETLRRSQRPIGRLLDVGCWDGEKTVAYGKALGVVPGSLYGVDCFDHVLSAARSRVSASRVDLETELLPFADGFFDVVICNQVFEHLKQIYRTLSEIHRVLTVDGALIFSVPNLASLHNRLLLLLGLQPTTIRIIGPHVRGFANRATREFLQLNGLFRSEAEVGVGFYPLPILLAGPFARLLPSLSHTTILVSRKQDAAAPKWDRIMAERNEQTNFF